MNRKFEFIGFELELQTETLFFVAACNKENIRSFSALLRVYTNWMESWSPIRQIRMLLMCWQQSEIRVRKSVTQKYIQRIDPFLHATHTHFASPKHKCSQVTSSMAHSHIQSHVTDDAVQFVLYSTYVCTVAGVASNSKLNPKEFNWDKRIFTGHFRVTPYLEGKKRYIFIVQYFGALSFWILNKWNL